MASSNRIPLRESMAEVWRNLPPGTTSEDLTRPIASPNTSGSTAPLPGRFTVVPGGNAAGEPGLGLPSCPASRGRTSDKDK